MRGFSGNWREAVVKTIANSVPLIFKYSPNSINQPMKKLLYLVAIIALCACSHQSDEVKIQKEILGVTIGKTSIDEAQDILQQQGLGLEQINRDTYGYVDNINFGGITWDCMALYTHKQKVRAIRFFKYNSNYAELIEEHKILAKNLMQKYESLYWPGLAENTEKTDSTHSRYSFIDEETDLSAGLSADKQSRLFLELVYENRDLESQYIHDTNNEL